MLRARGARNHFGVGGLGATGGGARRDAPPWYTGFASAALGCHVLAPLTTTCSSVVRPAVPARRVAAVAISTVCGGLRRDAPACPVRLH